MAESSTPDSSSRGPRGLPGRVIDAVVGSVVSPVIDNLDVPGVVDRIDVSDVVGRIDVNELLDRIDVNELLDRIEVDRVLDRIDVDRLLDRIDVDRLVDRIDADRLVQRVDIDGLIQRVDIDGLIQRVDVDGLVQRVDVDGLVGRLDVEALLDRVDLNRIVQRTELGEIIARSTSGVFTQLLDVVRTKLMVVDQVVQGLFALLLRRQARIPATPWDQAAVPDRPAFRELPPTERAVLLQGHYSGSVSRFLAFLVDNFFIGLLFTLGFTLVAAAASVVLGRTVSLSDGRWFVTVSYFVWAFLYLTVQLGVSGRTVGKALLGLLVVRRDGADVGFRAAAVRTACFPLSFLFFGAGFLLGLVRADRRELHDLLGRTAVVYAWDAKLAEMRRQRLDSP